MMEPKIMSVEGAIVPSTGPINGRIYTSLAVKGIKNHMKHKSTEDQRTTLQNKRENDIRTLFSY